MSHIPIDFSRPSTNALALMFMFTNLAHAQNVVKLNRRLMNEHVCFNHL